MEDEYEAKSYKLLLLWFIGFFVSIIAFPYLLQKNHVKIEEAIAVRISILLVLLALLLLFWIIYKTERIYWINGVSYKEAKVATSERRKAYALGHLNIFLKATVTFGVYCVIATTLDVHTGIDIAVFIIVIIVSVFKTFPIKL